MILSVHMLVGAAIGSKVKNYWAIFILAVVSHFILDAIPHWEYAGFKTGISSNAFIVVTLKAMLDILIGASVIKWVLKSSRLIRPAFFGAFGVLLPDGLIFIYTLAQVFFNRQLAFLAGPIAFHYKIHYHYADGADLLLWRIAAETVIAVAAIFVLRPAKRASRIKKQRRGLA